MIDQKSAPVEPAFSHFYGFDFDPFQLEAMEVVGDGGSVMVAAPTSSGKTLVAEYALWRALQAGSRAIYTTPIKALSNQKRRDLERLFPGKVGLLTGDRSQNADAPVVVMTTEVLRNMLVEDQVPLADVACVVFDEVHYLADEDRGTVWEEAIITCPLHVQLVCLSATIANAEDIAEWISETHRPIALIRHDERPVPLEHYYFSQNRLHMIKDESGRRRAHFPKDGRLDTPDPAVVVAAMERANLLPAIWFAFSRRAVEESAQRAAESAPKPTRAQLDTIESALTWTLDLLPAEDRDLPQLSALVGLLRRGVGFHHAGLLPPLKELVEHLFAGGHLSVVCATDTLAVGINMPARTVVISSMDRPFGGMLTPNDFSQLTGRAGRRGIDEWGAVVMLPGPHYTFEDAYAQVCGPLEPVLSAFRLRYSTLLSAMEGSDERLDHLVRSSLRQFQMKANARRAQIELAAARGTLDDTGDVDEAQAYLALQGELAQAERELKRARNARNKSPRSPQTIRRHERAKQERAELSRALRSHPYHGMAQTLERGDPERLATLRAMAKLESTIRQAQRECDQDAADTAAAVRSVLARMGYVKRGQLTRKARGLREIVAPAGIALVELYARGVFERLDAAEMAEVISWFAVDMRRKYNSYRLPRHLMPVRREAQETFRRISTLEESEGIELAQGPSSWFYGVALAWCRGDSVESITERIGLGEGDIVSALNKTVDLLDQFAGMLERYGDVDMLLTTGEARRRLVRGLVALVRTGQE